MHLTHALVSHANLGFFRGLAALEEANPALILSISVILGALALGCGLQSQNWLGAQGTESLLCPHFVLSK